MLQGRHRRWMRRFEMIASSMQRVRLFTRRFLPSLDIHWFVERQAKPASEPAGGM